MTNAIAIQMTDVGKRYGPHWVLSRMTLSIQQGETVALFGRNGSGKTTLLKIMATLIAPTTGTLEILNRDASREKREIRSEIRMLGHERQLYDFLTVTENLRLAAGIRGIPSGEEAIRTSLIRLGLEKVCHRRLGELSEGMKKRTVLARLLLGEAKIFLLDEPHPTLDQEGKEILNEMIREWKNQKKTVLLASHDHEQALEHADRVIVIESGRLQ